LQLKRRREFHPSGVEKDRLSLKSAEKKSIVLLRRVRKSSNNLPKKTSRKEVLIKKKRFGSLPTPPIRRRHSNRERCFEEAVNEKGARIRMVNSACT